VLLDENLSPRLIPRLASLFPGLIHVRDLGLKQADDREIWEWARTNRHSILTADADFVELSQRLGWPPKVIHFQRCDYPARVIENLLRQNAIRIAEFERDASFGVLAISDSRS
jgi:predicted nuclease of predicted toxin-antitoxin system